MEFSTTITIDGFPVIASVPRGTKAWRKANCVFCPLGPSHTQAWLLITRKMLNLITDTNTNQHVISWSQTGSAPISLNFSNLKIVKAERLLHGGPDDENALYLAEFADARYAAMKCSDTGEIFANVRNPLATKNTQDKAFLTTTLAGDDLQLPKTWESLVKALWNKCGFLGVFTGLPPLPLSSQPDTSIFQGLNAYTTLCAVLDQIDCAIQHDPLSDQYNVVQLGGAQNIVTNPSRLIWDGRPFRSQIDTAETIKSYFSTRSLAPGQERDDTSKANWLTDRAVAEPVSNQTGVVGSAGVKPYWEDAYGIFGENNTIVNQSALDAIARERQVRYAARRTVTSQHFIYSGLLKDYIPGGQIRAVIWRNWGDGEDNVFGGTVTEFVCGPDFVYGFDKNYEQGSTTFISQSSPERENYLPPDLGRRSYPNYPRVVNVVQIKATAISIGGSSGDPDPTAGNEVAPNADGFHLGVVRRWVANAMDTLDPCWIRFIDDHDTNLGNVNGVQGEFYGPGRLCGISTASGETLPVYLVKKGAVQTGVKFVNDSGYPIPPGGVMEIKKDEYKLDDDGYFHVVRPSNPPHKSSQGYLINNSFNEIPIDGKATCGSWNYNGEALCLYYQNSPDLGTDNTYGTEGWRTSSAHYAPQPGTFHLRRVADAYISGAPSGAGYDSEDYGFQHTIPDVTGLNEFGPVVYNYDYGDGAGAVTANLGRFIQHAGEPVELSHCFPLRTSYYYLSGSTVTPTDGPLSQSSTMNAGNLRVKQTEATLHSRIGIRVESDSAATLTPLRFIRSGVYKIELKLHVKMYCNTFDAASSFTDTAVSGGTGTYKKPTLYLLNPLQVAVFAVGNQSTGFNLDNDFIDNTKRVLIHNRSHLVSDTIYDTIYASFQIKIPHNSRLNSSSPFPELGFNIQIYPLNYDTTFEIVDGRNNESLNREYSWIKCTRLRYAQLLRE